jgi:hypothetical protein
MEYWGDGRTLGWGACPERKPKDRWSRALYLNLFDQPATLGQWSK